MSEYRDAMDKIDQTNNARDAVIEAAKAWRKYVRTHHVAVPSKAYALFEAVEALQEVEGG